MTERSKNRVALVTGAALRVGCAVARELHQAGVDIVVHYRSSADAARALVDELNAARSDSAAAIPADLADVESLKALVAQTIDRFGRLDVLVNNASSFYPTPVGEASEADWKDLFDSNARGPFFLAQAAAPHLKATSGSIINIIDIHAQKPMATHTVYCMAKSALTMMTHSLALELAPEVRVNGVSPGAILWPSSDPSEEEKARVLARVPMKRIGDPTDIAGAVSYFALKAPYVTGQILSIDGGRSLNM